MVEGGRAQGRGGGGRDARGVGGVARVLSHCTQGRKDSSGPGVGHPCAESSPCGHGRVPAYPQFPIRRFIEVARIWKAVAERRKAFKGDASCSANGEGDAAAAVVVISSDERRSDVLRISSIS
jgi:hypothetical protein